MTCLFVCFNGLTTPSIAGGSQDAKGLKNDEMDEIELEALEEAKMQFKIINKEYDSEIKSIFLQKCFSCHSTKTSYPWYYELPGVRQLIESDIKEALTHLDLTEGFPFVGHGTPDEDLEAIRETISNGDMPPLKYLLMHWNHKIDASEKKKIMDWTESSLKVLRQSE